MADKKTKTMKYMSKIKKKKIKKKEGDIKYNFQ